MFGRYPDTLPELLEVLKTLYKLEGPRMSNPDKLRACINYLLRILHK